MLRSRILIALGVCSLAASAAWADEVGYVDCSSHSEGTQVFAKPRKTPDIMAPLACGERFTILVYGFYFSRIQTKDGQVGYIYSNLIVVDHGAAPVQQATPQTTPPPARPAVEPVPSFQTASEKTKIPRTPPIDAEPAPAAATTPAQTVAAPTATAAPGVTSVESGASPAASVSETPAANGAVSATPSAAPSAVPAPPSTSAQPDATAPAKPQGDAAWANVTQTSVAASAATDAATAPTKQPEVSAGTTTEAVSPAPPQPDATAAQPATSNVTAQPAATQPEPAAQPEPAPAEPAPTPAIKPGDRTETWEKPNPTARTAPLVELFGGYAFTRVGGAGNGTNLNGALGSFGWNPTSWLQVVADSSYSEQTIGNTKNVLYGNHFGPRFFRRTRFRWGITPFAEALVGGSSEKTTISGSGGSTSNTGSAISYKVGGGIDIHPSRHWDVRLFDFDYYRTSFGSGPQQNNYWISSGVVLRLFGGRDE